MPPFWLSASLLEVRTPLIFLLSEILQTIIKFRYSTFAIAGPATDVTLHTWSYAGGTNAAGDGIARGGFDPIVSLFNASTGEYITANDDGGSNVPTDTNELPYDSFLMNTLAAGNYTATLTQYGSFARGPLLTDGFYGSGHTSFGSRDSHWAFDILNVESASVGASYISAIPEPESYALLLAGLGLVGFMVCRRDKLQIQDFATAA